MRERESGIVNSYQKGTFKKLQKHPSLRITCGRLKFPAYFTATCFFFSEQLAENALKEKFGYFEMRAAAKKWHTRK